MKLGSRSPAQVYALVFGAVLLVLGVAGFFWETSFAVGTSAGVEQDFLLDAFAVNGWHNLVHLLTGVLGLVAAANYAYARVYALGLGVVYALVALLGFVAASEDNLFGLLAINTADNFLHALIAVAGIGAWLATPAAPEPASASASASA